MKGPELKKPEVKAPKFLSDLYVDLKQQRLLPLVILLLVAIPAVPILLSDKTPTFVPPPPGEGLVPEGALTGDSLYVVAAQPGLRDAQERFQDRDPRDPFSSGVTPTASGGGGGGGGESDRSSVSGPVGSAVEPVPDGDSGGSGTSGSSYGGDSTGSGGSGSDGSGGSGGSGNPEPQVSYLRVAVSVRFGKAGSGLTRTVEDLPRMSGLPRRGAAAVYIGASEDGRRALFSVSPDVSGVKGKFQCSSGRPDNCQFLTLRPGWAASLYDARSGVTWRLALTSIDLIETELQPTATPPPTSRPPAGPAAGDDPVVDDPDRPVSSRAASLSEVIGLYLLK